MKVANPREEALEKGSKITDENYQKEKTGRGWSIKVKKLAKF